jgi:ATP-dependent RNA helicase RhlE
MKFETLKIIEPILRTLEKQKYSVPTSIQTKAIPAILDGNDLIGIAQTGTGKTAAFVIPLLQNLYRNPDNVRPRIARALILAPTRELAIQISEDIQKLGVGLKLRQLVLHGGVDVSPQKKELQKGVDILIATPGRLIDLMKKGQVHLENVKYFVLDEADRMLDMGFLKDVSKIISTLPSKKQSLFFSATMSNAVADLSKDFLKNSIRIEITPQSTPLDSVEQCVFFVDPDKKNDLLLDLIKQEKMNRTLVFVGKKDRVDKIADILRNDNITTSALHSNKSQDQRIRALHNFKTGKARILVATDIAARGIDIEDITHIINYDLPKEPENYIHRIGRTARAGKQGTAYIFCSSEEKNLLNQIERITKRKVQQAEHKYHSVKAKNAKIKKPASITPARQKKKEKIKRKYAKAKKKKAHKGKPKSKIRKKVKIRAKERAQSAGWVSNSRVTRRAK